MSTTIVTPEVAKPAHFASCTETAIGRRVKALVGIGTPETAYTLGFLMDNLDPFRGECRCFDIQLRAVEADLAVARKAERAGRAKTAVIADLVDRRDALRSVTR